ncbi:FhaA domain-containing protein [Flexivirga oryzae]|uniref:FHA domain-containing protein n=1 Tax=Flexivirga oryzae TaxID=1794944 RepID=A0A839NCA5_9MICO|nr:hypothetical protein [Flexivirga oryzae]
MGIFDKLERSIERGVNGAFARAFRSEVQPVEIASAMRRAMDDRAVSAGKGKRHIVPNLFVIELSSTDYEALVSEHEDDLADDLIATASEHAESQRYQPGGPVSVQFTEDSELETGVFRLRPSTARQVQPDMRRMPGRMPPARTPDDPRRPAGQEPQYGGDAPGLDTPPPLRSSGTRPAAPGDLDTGSPSGSPYSATSGGSPYSATSGSPPYSATSGDSPYSATSGGSGTSGGSPYSANEGGYAAAAEPAHPARPKRDDHRPSPAAPRRLRQRPWLDIDGERYPLLGAITVIGRDDDTDIVLDDPGVSRRHSEIRITYDGPHQVITIRDLGSTNGTYVNGDPIDSIHLADGDRLTIGRTHLLLHEGGTR